MGKLLNKWKKEKVAAEGFGVFLLKITIISGGIIKNMAKKIKF